MRGLTCRCATFWLFTAAIAIAVVHPLFVNAQDEIDESNLRGWGDKTCWCWVGVEEQDEKLIELPTGLVFKGPINAGDKKRDCSRRCSALCRDAFADPSEICSKIGRPLSAAEVANLGCFSVVGADDGDNNKWDYDGRPCANFSGCERVCECPPGSQYASPRGSCVAPGCPVPGMPDGDKGGGYSVVGGQLFQNVPGARNCRVQPVCTGDCGTPIDRPLTASGSASSESGCDRFGGAVSTVIVSAVGGTAPYTVGGPMSSSAVEAPIGTWTMAGVPAGSATYTITDAAGATAQVTVQVVVAPVTVAVTVQKGPTCCGCNNGSASVSAQGQPPLTYRWQSVSGVTGSTTTTAQALPAGLYTVVVTDSRGCYSTTEVSLQDPVDCPSQPTGGAGASNTTYWRDSDLPVWDLGTLSAGGEFNTEVTARNASCPGRHNFVVEVEGADWLRITGKTRLTGIPRGAEKSTKAVVDLSSVEPGEHRGLLHVRCEDCPPSCKQDQQTLEVRVTAR